MNPLIEDVFPIEDVGCSISMLVYQGVHLYTGSFLRGANQTQKKWWIDTLKTEPSKAPFWEVQVVDLLVSVGKYTVRPMDASSVFRTLKLPQDV